MNPIVRTCLLGAFVIASTGSLASAATPNALLEAIPSLAEDVRRHSASGGSGEPTSTPPPEEGTCPVFRMAFGYSSYSCRTAGCDGGGYIGSNTTEEIYDRRSEERPSCLDSMINDVANACRRAVELRYVDDCVSHSLQGIHIGQDERRYPVLPRYANFIDAGKNAVCSWTAFLPGRFWTDGRAGLRCNAGRIYFDQQCRPVRPTRDVVRNACLAGRLRWEASPISLLFDNSLEQFRANTRVVEFSLEPSRGKWSVWKASAQAPLLVYDPQHRGTISGPEQLFGHHTFGGKQYAASVRGNSTTDQPAARGRWDNGFEALASLDRNGDQRVSGEELLPLGLWFDANQNGISEPGEVRSLTEMGVTALFYQIDERDPVTKDLIVRIGYERVVDGKVQTGMAVDWFGESAHSELELVQRQMALGQVCDSGISQQQSAVDTVTTATASLLRAPLDADLISSRASLNQEFKGTWNWKSKSGATANGILVFSPLSAALPDGLPGVSAEAMATAVQGLSLVEAEFAEVDESGLSRVASLLRINGTVSYNTLGEKVLTFQHHGEDGLLIESTAKLINSGTELQGHSVAKMPGSGGVVVRAQYTWSAHRKYVVAK